MKEEFAMKKIYNAPQADLLCFRACEALAAIDFENLVDMNYKAEDNKPAVTSEQDIIIDINMF
jgi:hypothetical protein